jgi:epoxyqueuosine reductase
MRRLDDTSPLVRAMAVWALSRLMAPEAFRALAAAHREEGDEDVRREWAATMA